MMIGNWLLVISLWLLVIFQNVFLLADVRKRLTSNK